MPDWLIYILLYLSAVIENLMPPFPGDTITVFGAYLSGIGILNPFAVFSWTAAGNLTSNLIIYFLGRSRQSDLIRKHKWIIDNRMLARAALFYRRWGVGALFVSRFLVGLRSIVPLFAGISRVRLRRFLLPIMISIAVQHVLLVYLGYSIGENWSYIKQFLGRINLGLGVVALAVVGLLYFWIRRVLKEGRIRIGRRHSRKSGSGEQGKDHPDKDAEK